MRKLHAVLSVLLITFILGTVAWSASDNSVKAYSKKIVVNKATRTVNIVDVDLKDKRIKVDAAVANDKTQTVEDLLSLVKRKKAVAAINANFFAAYSDFSPVGAIAHDGEYLWHTYYGTSVGISDDNEVLFQTNDFKGRAKLFINSIEQHDYTWYLNREDFKRSTIIFNNWRNPSMKLNKGAIVIVKDGFISEVKFAPADIAVPEKGFVLCFNMDVTPALKELINTKYKVGQQVNYRTLDNSYGFIDEKKYGEIITAGPRLLVDGRVEINPTAEGFSEKKIIEYRAQRSALGLTKDNRLLMVTVSNVTIYELADIMKQLGAYQAMNLDGGASSGLYANGKIITAPGRKLSTFLTVRIR